MIRRGRPFSVKVMSRTEQSGGIPVFENTSGTVVGGADNGGCGIGGWVDRGVVVETGRGSVFGRPSVSAKGLLIGEFEGGDGRFEKDESSGEIGWATTAELPEEFGFWGPELGAVSRSDDRAVDEVSVCPGRTFEVSPTAESESM